MWESKVLLHLSGQLGTLLSMQAAGQGLQLATHSFFYAGAGGRSSMAQPCSTAPAGAQCAS